MPIPERLASWDNETSPVGCAIARWQIHSYGVKIRSDGLDSTEFLLSPATRPPTAGALPTKTAWRAGGSACALAVTRGGWAAGGVPVARGCCRRPRHAVRCGPGARDDVARCHQAAMS